MRYFQAALITTITLLPSYSFAQGAAAYPNKPVRVIVAAAPGGASDTLTRMFTQRLSVDLGQQFVVDNRSGGGGKIAYALVADSAADGYTLLFTSAAFTYAPVLYSNFPHPIKGFAPITLAIKAPYVLVVNPALSVNSVKELIAVARSKPGMLNVGVTNAGFTHVAAAYLASDANINVTYIPYQGSGQIMVDTIAGRLHATFGNVLSTMPHVKSGKLRALAVSSAERSAVIPELPTLSESGVPGFDISSWFGWLAPAGTPVAITRKLSGELARVVKSQEVVKKLALNGGEAVGSTPEQFQKFIAVEVPRWRKVVKNARMRVE